MPAPSFPDVSPATRKAMRANKGKDTKPEMVVRRLVHGMGFRYRLHRKDLPGKPDLAFGPRRKVIFVHGCFWHAHENCTRSSRPKTRAGFWAGKFARNRERDQQALRRLQDIGWGSMIVWECDLKDTGTLRAAVSRFLTG